MWQSPKKFQQGLTDSDVSAMSLSPDRLQARNRLDTLLTEMRIPDSSIDETTELGRLDHMDSPRKSEAKRSQLAQESYTFEIEDDSASNSQSSIAVVRSSQPAMKQRGARRERRVVFELRGKPFELKDKAAMMGVFRLCRTWMHGKDDDTSAIPSIRHPYPTEDSLDLLATKEILALPQPKPATNDGVEEWPEPVIFDANSVEGVDVESAESMLNGYMGHWKGVRRRWTDHSHRKELRFTKSLALLETVYNIAQQSQLP